MTNNDTNVEIYIKEFILPATDNEQEWYENYRWN